ncbi:MAG TPA: hypothetical protein VKG44_08385, partial [Candidatus Baltobacteraceae bacterium]|nr:hypothetical protein [Candidatus Baltobacteraceae bacterium]
MGEGLHEHGALQPAASERTLSAVAQFVERVRAQDARLTAIATSAMRRADNAGEFAERMRDLTGVPLRILSGEEEASGSFRG